MRTSPHPKGRSPSRRPRGAAETESAAPASGGLLRNTPPEPRAAEQPGTGAPGLQPVTVTVRRCSRWRTRSGRVRRDWELMFDATSPATLDPLTGQPQTSDPLAGHKVAFHTADAAIAFARRKGWGVRVVGDGFSEQAAPADAASALGGRRPS